MTRHFSNIRDDIKHLEENINGIAEKTLEVLERRNILKLNEEKEEDLKNSQKDNINSEFHKQANMRTLKKLIVFFFFCLEISKKLNDNFRNIKKNSDISLDLVLGVNNFDLLLM